MPSIKELNKLRIFNRLKSVYRLNSVDKRKESSAEHSWSCLILADFFLSKTKRKINRLKVYELLMYHDVVEIEAGDSPLHPGIKHLDKKEKEKKAVEILRKDLPFPLNSKFARLFKEFEEQKTIESRFAKAIDAMDSEIHEMDHKEDWDGWTAEFLKEKKAKYFEEFPELKKTFSTLMKYLIKNGYFATRNKVF